VRRRLTCAILLLYPRRVRDGHGSEIAALIDDLVAHEGRSPAGLLVRLALDGLVQRMATTATAWTLAAVLAATSLGGLAASDFAAASVDQGAQRTIPTVAPARRTHQTPYHAPRSHHNARRSARTTARAQVSALEQLRRY
jgi:hypothetical protein